MQSFRIIKSFIPGLLIILLVSCLFSEEKNKKKFQIEFYGGFSTLNPADLNLRVDSMELEEKFFHGDYYDYLKGYNLIAYDKIE